MMSKLGIVVLQRDARTYNMKYRDFLGYAQSAAETYDTATAVSKLSSTIWL